MGLVGHILDNALGFPALVGFGTAGTVQQFLYAPFSRQFPLIGGFTLETPFSDPTQSYVVGESGMSQDFQLQAQFRGQSVIPGLPVRTHTTGLLDYAVRHSFPIPGVESALELIHPGRVSDLRSETLGVAMPEPRGGPEAFFRDLSNLSIGRVMDASSFSPLPTAVGNNPVNGPDPVVDPGISIPGYVDPFVAPGISIPGYVDPFSQPSDLDWAGGGSLFERDRVGIVSAGVSRPGVSTSQASPTALPRQGQSRGVQRVRQHGQKSKQGARRK